MCIASRVSARAAPNAVVLQTEECKTYKIIMNKLDELNRLFAARARSPAARAPRRPAPSSGSVSVSDKLVATEPEPRNTLQVNHNTVSVHLAPQYQQTLGGATRCCNTVLCAGARRVGRGVRGGRGGGRPPRGQSAPQQPVRAGRAAATRLRHRQVHTHIHTHTYNLGLLGSSTIGLTTSWQIFKYCLRITS